MKNILESNELIAKFIGVELLKDLLASNKGFINIDIDIYEQCKFHNDWNWLMKVVEKIEIQSEELFGAYEDVIINGCGCGIATKDDMISIVATSKIEAVYIACVEYIKWYNEQNKK